MISNDVRNSIAFEDALAEIRDTDFLLEVAILKDEVTDFFIKFAGMRKEGASKFASEFVAKLLYNGDWKKKGSEK